MGFIIDDTDIWCGETKKHSLATQRFGGEGCHLPVTLEGIAPKSTPTHRAANPDEKH
jgi:hypothetical protein